MSSFHKQSFAARFGAMGDEAESVFEKVWPDNWERFGLNRPRLHMASLPERIRHTPDYLTSSNLVEVKGIGRDDTIKIKVSELNCMHYWNQVHPLVLFVWSSHRKAWTCCPPKVLQQLIDGGHATLDRYHDGRAYFAIRGEHFEWTEVSSDALPE